MKRNLWFACLLALAMTLTFSMVGCGGDSGTSRTVSKPTAAPVDFAVISGNGFIRISWASVEGAEEYAISRRWFSGTTLMSDNFTVVDTEFVDFQVQNWRNYEYSVRAVNSAGQGPAAVMPVVMPGTSFNGHSVTTAFSLNLTVDNEGNFYTSGVEYNYFDLFYVWNPKPKSDLALVKFSTGLQEEFRLKKGTFANDESVNYHYLKAGNRTIYAAVQWNQSFNDCTLTLFFDSYIFAFEQDGSEQWRYKLPERTWITALEADASGVYVASVSQDNGVYRITKLRSSSSGQAEAVWQVEPINNGFISDLRVWGNGRLYVGGSFAGSSGLNSFLTCCNAATGKIIWTAKAGSRGEDDQVRAVAINQSGVYSVGVRVNYTTEMTTLFWYRYGFDGKMLESREAVIPGVGFINSVEADDYHLFFLRHDSTFAFNLDGSELWRSDKGGFAMVRKWGILYILDNDPGTHVYGVDPWTGGSPAKG